MLLPNWKINEGGLWKIDNIVKLKPIPFVRCFLLVVVDGKWSTCFSIKTNLRSYFELYQVFLIRAKYQGDNRVVKSLKWQTWNKIDITPNFKTLALM